MRRSSHRRRAVILLSGGLDSSTCLAVARARGFEAHCLSVDYGQRHRGEPEDIDSRKLCGRRARLGF